MAEEIQKLSFEEAMSEMEKTVKSLEEGDLSLEESLKKFEYGIGLSRHLHGKLKSAELRINELVKESGELVERPLDISLTEEDTGDEGSQ
ncbi:MAG: exodeoxyribonuclease VII small subunit [Candidatus Thermoplasmatota archaeon]|jgi:exodeoxyribonuclease VII small subunit|nr:exodeoxyribonuclease VII small subunit [Candidatus Thermoplasmatota archaeon]MDP7422847.1 exodeoxyribonuclease VII small subunit [bacterium]